MVSNTSYPITTGPITVTVGVGGTPGLYSTAINGGNGGNSVFGTITAVGGGGGGTENSASPNGNSGGSGGGGNGYSNGA